MATAATPDPSAAGEAAAIAAIVASVTRMLEHTYPAGARPMRRDAHPKHHGVVVGEFRVGPDVPPDLRHGVFATPAAWPAWIRLSNGVPKVQHDLRRDVRGYAIKLLGVSGPKLLEDEADVPTHDFILASAPTSFVRNPIDYVPFSLAVERKHPFSGFFFRGGIRGVETKALLKSAIRIRNPLGISYWSQVPYRLGPHVVKYKVQPQAPVPSGRYGPGADYLRRNMAATLQQRSVTFDFLVQRQTDLLTMPVEDAVMLWDEAVSPFVKVATITIPRQIFDSPEQMRAAEHLSFTPWRCLPEHEPLGGINRVRRVVYREISIFRHRANGVARSEPEPGAMLPGSVLL